VIDDGWRALRDLIGAFHISPRCFASEEGIEPNLKDDQSKDLLPVVHYAEMLFQYIPYSMLSTV